MYLVNYFDNYVKTDKPGRAVVLARLVGGAQEPPLLATLEEARRDLLLGLRNLPGLECALIDPARRACPPKPPPWACAVLWRIWASSGWLTTPLPW